MGCARRASAALAFVTASAIAVAPAASLAKPAAPDPLPDPYKQHMQHGVKLYEDGNYKAAIAEFEAAYRLRPRASPLVDIALSHKRLFDYPKAIAALEKALAEHADTMDAADRDAARDAIAEMRGLLSYVRFHVTPPHARLSIDGEPLSAAELSQPVPLGPGTHTIAAAAEGYAPFEQSITVVSGEKGRVIAVQLVADKGHVVVKTGDPKALIAVDQRPVGHGEWAGLLPPGTHLVQMFRPSAPPYAVQIQVVPGQSQEIRPGFGGVPIAAAAQPAVPGAQVPSPPIPPPPKAEPPKPPMRGFYALASGSLLFPLIHPRAFDDPKANSGGAGGIRLGYRVNTPASFDLMAEYANVFTPSKSEPDSGYTLESVRVGLNLRLMTPGRKVRFVGGIGAGLVYDSMTFDVSDRVKRALGDPSSDPQVESAWRACAELCSPASGFDPYVLGELGLELDFSGVLLGAAAQSYFQSARAIETDAGLEVYGSTDPLAHLGLSLRVGYATW